MDLSREIGSESVIAGLEDTDRIAYAMEAVDLLADSVLSRWEGVVDTHYAQCYKVHVGCFARLVKEALDV